MTWVAVAGRPAGAVVVSDAPREEAAQAVAMLQRQKLHCAMLTGAPDADPVRRKQGPRLMRRPLILAELCRRVTPTQ